MGGKGSYGGVCGVGERRVKAHASLPHDLAQGKGREWQGEGSEVQGAMMKGQSSNPWDSPLPTLLFTHFCSHTFQHRAGSMAFSHGQGTDH